MVVVGIRFSKWFHARILGFALMLIFCSSRKVLYRDVYISISGSCFNLIVQSTVRIITISPAFVVWISPRGSMPHNAAWSPISYGHLPAQLPSLCNEGTCGHWSGGTVVSLQSIPGTEEGRRGGAEHETIYFLIKHFISCRSRYVTVTETDCVLGFVLARFVALFPFIRI